MLIIVIMIELARLFALLIILFEEIDNKPKNMLFYFYVRVFYLLLNKYYIYIYIYYFRGFNFKKNIFIVYVYFVMETGGALKSPMAQATSTACARTCSDLWKERSIHLCYSHRDL